MIAVNQYYRALSRGGAGSLYDLSAESGWLHCYSMAKRFPIATNSMRIIRDSDSTQLDIGFLADGSLDISSINSFCSGTTGRIHTYYDQFSTNNLTILGTPRPIIYQSGAFLGYITNIGLASCFQFGSDFNTNQNFSYVCSFYFATTHINKRSTGPNAGMVITLTGTEGTINTTYYGVANWALGPEKTDLINNDSNKKYISFFNSSAYFAGSSYVEGIDSDALTLFGTSTLSRTQNTATTTTKLGIGLTSAGAITGTGLFKGGSDIFLFSTDKTANTNIFNKRYFP